MNLDNENRKRLKMIGIFGTIPFVLAIPPMIGWAIGNWLDKKWETTPYLMYGMLIIGFIAGIREFYRLIKKYGENGP